MAPGGQRSRADRPFERLYRRHVHDVYRYALAVLANPADAEDVTQTAFLNACRAFQAGQRPERPLNWLIAITHNVCRQRFRDAARRPMEVVLDRELAAESDHDDGGGFRQEDIRRALSQLTFSQRSALAMRELEGRSYREIAEVLGVTEAAVETLIFRARRAFREQLEGSLSCSEAERAISRQLDGMLARGERAGLRAHLRACAECASLARRLRGQRAALRGVAIVPLPQSLASFSAAGGSGVAGGAALVTGLGIKVAALGAAALVAAGVSTEIVMHSAPRPAHHAAHAVLNSEQVAPSRPVAEQALARSGAALAGATIVPLLAGRSAHGPGSRGKAAESQSRTHHRPATTVWPTRTVGSATRAVGNRRSERTNGGTPHATRGLNRPSQAGRSAKAGEPAGTPDSRAQRATKKDELKPNGAAAGSASNAHDPQSSSASAGSPPEGIPADRPAEPASAAASKTKDTETRKP